MLLELLIPGKIVLNLLHKGGNENAGAVFFLSTTSLRFSCMDAFSEYPWRINFTILEGLNYVLQR